MRSCGTMFLPPELLATPQAAGQAAELLCAPKPVAQNDARLRAAVVGLGHQALSEQLPRLVLSNRVRLVAVCDENPVVVREQQLRLQVAGYTDFSEMFASEEFDLVLVCVPHHVGAAVIEEAAEHGVHVLKEKPFATTLAEAKRLVERCEQSGIQLMVSLQRRLNPIHASFQLLADQIGTPFVFEGRYTMHIADPSEGWRGSAATAGGGCVIDMGYHLIDLVLWYLGLPDQITAHLSTGARPDQRYDAEDTALLHLSYNSGLYGSLLLSRFLGPKTEQLRVVGTRGVVQLGRNRIQRLTNAGDVIETVLRKPTGQAAGASQVDYFARVIDGSRPNPSGPRAHLRHLAFVAACYQAARTHAPASPREFL